jgi:DNA-binding NarL/FixJ family response regulator
MRWGRDPEARADTVLVVDDTPESLRMLVDMLEAEAMHVLVATSGEAALDVLSFERPDLILMDAVMPGMGGFAATRAIKSNPVCAGIPVIFMTGLTELDHVVEALEAGAVDYVRKPLLVPELIARARVHMNNARVAEDSQAALDASGRSLIALDRAGRLKWQTPEARRILAEHFPMDEDWSHALPAALELPIAQLLEQGESGATSLRIELPTATLELARLTQVRAGDVLIRLNDVNPGAAVVRLHTTYGLTPREAEVLLWISYGKPNRDISEILGISPRTVNKHLEHLFQKLGVETRSAAAAFATRSLVQ